jgi:hypothetical protein
LSTRRRRRKLAAGPGGSARVKLIDTDHPMLKPLWVRVLLVAICLGWALFEFTGGSGAWGMLFLALGLYAAWAFFLAPSGKG